MKAVRQRRKRRIRKEIVSGKQKYQGTCRKLQVFSDNGGQDMKFKIVHEIKGRIRIHMD